MSWLLDIALTDKTETSEASQRLIGDILSTPQWSQLSGSLVFMVTTIIHFVLATTNSYNSIQSSNDRNDCETVFRLSWN